MKRRNFLAQAGSIAALSTLSRRSEAASFQPSVVIAWNGALTSSIAATFTPPTVAARAMSMTYEAVFNAWAAYRSDATFTLAGIRKRPAVEFKPNWKSIAVSYAAYTVLSDLFPTRANELDAALSVALTGLPVGAAEGVAAMQTGQLAGRILLQTRASDGSNQYGTLAAGAYSDYTGYKPVNTVGALVDPSRWQPLIVTNAQGVTGLQTCLTPHWGSVRPFALSSGSSLRPDYTPGPSMAEMNQLIAMSAGLNDAQKAQVDFFANNPGSVTPPGQWSKFAEIASATDKNSLDSDVVMFFLLGQAMLDASIAAWDAKRAYDTARPITAIRYYFAGQTVQCWGGPGTGMRSMLGQAWMPYQRAINPSPNFQEFVSGHSTFSAAAATVLGAFRGDALALKFQFAAGAVPFDPTVPAAPVALGWTSMSAAADAAGLSRRYGGIHFEQGDIKGRVLGAAVGNAVLRRAMTLYVSGGDGSSNGNHQGS